MDDMSRKTQKHVETQVRENVRKTSWHAKERPLDHKLCGKIKKLKAN